MNNTQYLCLTYMFNMWLSLVHQSNCQIIPSQTILIVTWNCNQQLKSKMDAQISTGITGQLYMHVIHYILAIWYPHFSYMIPGTSYTLWYAFHLVTLWYHPKIVHIYMCNNMAACCLSSLVCKMAGINQYIMAAATHSHFQPVFKWIFHRKARPIIFNPFSSVENLYVLVFNPYSSVAAA